MWLLMPSGGFISIVQKPSDVGHDTVTVRSRVRSDLIELRDNFLPQLGVIKSNTGTDYPHRAVVHGQHLEKAMAVMARAVTYPNYKDEVVRVKGSGRARLYHAVWASLLKLQSP